MERLDPRMVLGAYAVGVFPMADHRAADSVYWVEPKRRSIMPLNGFHLSRSLRKTIAGDRYRVTADTAFDQIIRLCAESAVDRPETWISGPIETVFVELHRLGFAHSIECWEGDRLAGGLYGLALGRAFFGESMVSRARDASKVALAWLVARLKQGGFSLLDCQFQTDHLASLGAVEISRTTYLGLLASAVSGVVAGGVPAGPASSATGSSGSAAGDFAALDALLAAPLPGGAASGAGPGKRIAQLLTEIS
ncbi:leucyl/phenylalanyl-tRNA--protein transferase [Sphingomonas sp.]|uniref:leucyl/phenylalanyl-tRNA--protein transferase n=1 Tax=Sphingomonas sp. TaxID=28214 RepID=UPI001DC2CB35|nr:leucyl/phenylalanyl-tRNA--protein transferase [Sphingomonas sp.]MBX9795264.1 leucyl/phenylalanyl-tRNA--protein transferase [Sphingomonas sp.]